MDVDFFLQYSLQYSFYNWHNMFPLFFVLSKIRQFYLQSGNILWIINFIAFDFIILSDWNSHPNNQYFCHGAHFHQFLLGTYSHENISQSHNVKRYSASAYFLLQMNGIFLSAVIVLLLNWHHIAWILILS